MPNTELLKARVDGDIKKRVHEVARREQVNESIWLRRAILLALRSTDDGRCSVSPGLDRRPRSERLYVRLRREDQMLLCERAQARGMAPATYVSVLTRAHLRQLAPLPKEELAALKRSVAELGAIGRNLNQIARAATQGARIGGPNKDELRALLKVSQVLHQNVKKLIQENLNSWALGHGDASN